MQGEAEWQSRAIDFPLDHPTAEGHFPSHPLIPGAVLLDMILAELSQGGTFAPGRVRAAKFLSEVPPGGRLRLRWRRTSDEIRFEAYLSTGQLAVSGILVREAPQS